MQFKDIVGQLEVKQHLVETVNQNRISHAQLFLGPEGSGSLALAIAYAQLINCTNKQTNDSCGECPSCTKYQKLIHPDLHFSYPFFAKGKDDVAQNYVVEWRNLLLKNPYTGMDEWREQFKVDNKQANINVAECHHIIQKLSLKPFEGEYKVLIMWLPEYLEKSANTLLKIIEEPAEKTLFLLVTENQEQLLNTIISRTQIVKIAKYGANDVKQFLIKNKGADEMKAQQITYLANGNLYLAQQYLVHDENDYHDLLVKWLRACNGNKGLEIINYVEEIAKQGRENQKNFLKYGSHVMREVLLYLSDSASLIHLPPAEFEFISKISTVLDFGKVEFISATFDEAHYHIERNANPKILFLDVSLMLVKALKFNTYPLGAQHILV